MIHFPKTFTTLQPLILILAFMTFGTFGFSQVLTSSLTVELDISPEVRGDFEENGRLYLFLSKNSRVEPRMQTWPSPYGGNTIFAKNIKTYDSNEVYLLKSDDSWTSTAEWSLDAVPEGDYYVQVLWDQDQSESRIDAPGNLYTGKQKVRIDKDVTLKLKMDQAIEERELIQNDLVKEVDFKSELLSTWWDKTMMIKASVLLPHNYDESKAYPIRYNVAGYGGRYTRVNRLVSNEEFMEWWDSEESPQVINVFLDGEGPFGDSYQMDSENSGPYGTSLVNELIPFIEQMYRGTASPTTRFVDGCSTGGWVSLGLQLYYPDVFNGVFSYSPDAVEFENYQLINIYKDKNAYINEFGYPRPVMRSTNGEPMMTLKQFINYENVLGSSNTYLNSGGQFSAHNALYSPKGEDGLPMPIFDPNTGEIDQEVAEHWKKYDFKLYAEKNWENLGPKIQGKIFVWMGDMDNFYLNPATRELDDFFKATENPKSDAVIEFTHMSGHCSEFSNREVLMQIQERLELIEKDQTMDK